LIGRWLGVLEGVAGDGTSRVEQIHLGRDRLVGSGRPLRGGLHRDGSPLCRRQAHDRHDIRGIRGDHDYGGRCCSALLHGLLARENRSSSGLMTAHQIFSRQDAYVPFAMEATMPGGQFRRYP
jgi:hypothetical protein